MYIITECMLRDEPERQRLRYSSFRLHSQIMFPLKPAEVLPLRAVGIKDI